MALDTPGQPGIIRISNAITGGEAYVTLAAYRNVWYALGWRSPLDDPAYTGGSSTPAPAWVNADTLAAAIADQHTTDNGTYDSLAVATARPNSVTSLVHKLKAGVEMCGITNLGDSTSYGTTSGFYLTMQWLAAQYPAYTFSYRLWNDTTQGLGLPSSIQVGTAGRRSLVITGASTDYFMTVPDSAATSPTGDMTVVTRLRLATTTPAVNWAIASKFITTGNQRSCFLELQPSGKLALYTSTDGIGSTNKVSTVALPTNLAGQLMYYSASIDVDNGASGYDIRFWYSSDALTWTQLGATVTTAGTTSIFDSTSPWQFYGRGAAVNADATMSGTEFHQLLVYTAWAANNDLTTMAPVVDLVPGYWTGLGTGAQFTDFCGNAVTVTGSTGSVVGAPFCAVINASTPGQAIAYSSNGTRFPKQTPFPSDVTFVNYGHNEASTLAYRASVKTLTDLVLAKTTPAGTVTWADTGIVLVGQNPRQSPATNITNHAIRIGEIAAFAVSQRFGFVDVYKAFQNLGITDWVGGGYINSDGIHPSDASGYPLVATELKKLFRQADPTLAVAA